MVVNIGSIFLNALLLISFGYEYPISVSPAEVKIVAPSTSANEVTLMVPEITYINTMYAGSSIHRGFDAGELKEYLETEHDICLDISNPTTKSVTFKLDGTATATGTVDAVMYDDSTPWIIPRHMLRLTLGNIGNVFVRGIEAFNVTVPTVPCY